MDDSRISQIGQRCAPTHPCEFAIDEKSVCPVSLLKPQSVNSVIDLQPLDIVVFSPSQDEFDLSTASLFATPANTSGNHLWYGAQPSLCARISLPQTTCSLIRPG